MSLDIHSDVSVQLHIQGGGIHRCPVCEGSWFHAITVIANSYQCNNCGAWVCTDPPIEPDPHHNID